jgi:hypothetical protein
MDVDIVVDDQDAPGLRFGRFGRAIGGIIVFEDQVGIGG